MIYREAPAPPGTCPRCRETLLGLRRSEAGSLQDDTLPGVRWCEKCGGVMADIEASQRVVAQMDRDLLEVGFQAARGRTRKPDTGRVIRCPECQFEMVRTRIESAACFVDACPSHGTWFDAGELVDVMRAYARSRKAGVPVPVEARAGRPSSAPDIEIEPVRDNSVFPLSELVSFIRWVFTERW